jgi:Na+/serine symporter
MDELSVISLDQAKNHLVVLNDSFYDAQITGIIKTAVGMVEQYTDYRLYQRDVVIPMVNCRHDIALFPITISGVDNDGNAQAYKAYQRTLSIVVDCPTWYNSVINTSVGYEDVTKIPYPLIGACYKIITYLFENKDCYDATIPYDVQVIINQLRRSPTI